MNTRKGINEDYTNFVYEKFLDRINKRIIRLTKKGEAESNIESFKTTGKGVRRFIGANYIKEEGSVNDFPYIDFIKEESIYIIVSTLDGDFLEEKTLTNKDLYYLIKERDRSSEKELGGVTVYFGNGNLWLEIADETPGLINYTYILFPFVNDIYIKNL